MHLPELGVGLVLWRETAFLLDRCASAVDAIEIEPEAFWLPTPDGGFRYDADAFAPLKAIALPKLVHSVSFPVGGTASPDARGLALLRKIVETLDAPWASMHMSFNQRADSHDRTHAGFLLPPLQSDEGVALAARNLRTAANALGVPIAFETGVNYLRPTPGEMHDGAFVAAIASAADCGILLDLHNIWVNARNGRQSVEDFLAEIPLERVWEIHVAGGECQDGYWLDAHSRLATREILDLTAQVVRRLPNLKAIIFEMLPAYASSVPSKDLLRQMEALRDAWSQRGTKIRLQDTRTPRLSDLSADVHPKDWEAALIDQLTGTVGRGSLAATLSKDPGVDLYRRLIREARSGAIVDACKLTCRRILLHDPCLMDALVHEYLHASRPALFAVAEGIGFLEFVIARLHTASALADVANLEHALLCTMIHGGRKTVVFRGNPLMAVEALADRRAPPPESTEVFTLVVENGVVASAEIAG